MLQWFEAFQQKRETDVKEEDTRARTRLNTADGKSHVGGNEWWTELRRRYRRRTTKRIVGKSAHDVRAWSQEALTEVHAEDDDEEDIGEDPEAPKSSQGSAERRRAQTAWPPAKRSSELNEELPGNRSPGHQSASHAKRQALRFFGRLAGDDDEPEPADGAKFVLAVANAAVAASRAALQDSSDHPADQGDLAPASDAADAAQEATGRLSHTPVDATSTVAVGDPDCKLVSTFTYKPEGCNDRADPAGNGSPLSWHRPSLAWALGTPSRGDAVADQAEQRGRSSGERSDRLEGADETFAVPAEDTSETAATAAAAQEGEMPRRWTKRNSRTLDVLIAAQVMAGETNFELADQDNDELAQKYKWAEGHRERILSIASSAEPESSADNPGTDVFPQDRGPERRTVHSDPGEVFQGIERETKSESGSECEVLPPSAEADRSLAASTEATEVKALKLPRLQEEPEQARVETNASAAASPLEETAKGEISRATSAESLQGRPKKLGRNMKMRMRRPASARKPGDDDGEEGEANDGGELAMAVAVEPDCRSYQLGELIRLSEDDETIPRHGSIDSIWQNNPKKHQKGRGMKKRMMRGRQANGDDADAVGDCVSGDDNDASGGDEHNAAKPWWVERFAQPAQTEGSKGSSAWDSRVSNIWRLHEQDTAEGGAGEGAVVAQDPQPAAVAQDSQPVALDVQLEQSAGTTDATMAGPNGEEQSQSRSSPSKRSSFRDRIESVVEFVGGASDAAARKTKQPSSGSSEAVSALHTSLLRSSVATSYSFGTESSLNSFTSEDLWLKLRTSVKNKQYKAHENSEDAVDADRPDYIAGTDKDEAKQASQRSKEEMGVELLIHASSLTETDRLLQQGSPDEPGIESAGVEQGIGEEAGQAELEQGSAAQGAVEPTVAKAAEVTWEEPVRLTKSCPEMARAAQSFSEPPKSAKSCPFVKPFTDPQDAHRAVLWTGGLMGWPGMSPSENVEGDEDSSSGTEDQLAAVTATASCLSEKMTATASCLSEKSKKSVHFRASIESERSESMHFQERAESKLSVTKSEHTGETSSSSIAYDPSGVPETYNIYTRKDRRVATQRKSENAYLAQQKLAASLAATAQTEEEHEEVAAKALSSTDAFTFGANRLTRSRTAVSAPTGADLQKLDITATTEVDDEDKESDEDKDEERASKKGEGEEAAVSKTWTAHVENGNAEKLVAQWRDLAMLLQPSLRMHGNAALFGYFWPDLEDPSEKVFAENASVQTAAQQAVAEQAGARAQCSGHPVGSEEFAWSNSQQWAIHRRSTVNQVKAEQGTAKQVVAASAQATMEPSSTGHSAAAQATLEPPAPDNTMKEAGQAAHTVEEATEAAEASGNADEAVRKTAVASQANDANGRVSGHGGEKLAAEPSDEPMKEGQQSTRDKAATPAGSQKQDAMKSAAETAVVAKDVVEAHETAAEPKTIEPAIEDTARGREAVVTAATQAAKDNAELTTAQQPATKQLKEQVTQARHFLTAGVTRAGQGSAEQAIVQPLAKKQVFNPCGNESPGMVTAETNAIVDKGAARPSIAAANGASIVPVQDPVGKRPRVGSSVLVSDSGLIGTVAEIEYGGDELPYKVAFDNGPADWFRESQVEVLPHLQGHYYIGQEDAMEQTTSAGADSESAVVEKAAVPEHYYIGNFNTQEGMVEQTSEGAVTESAVLEHAVVKGTTATAEKTEVEEAVASAAEAEKVAAERAAVAQAAVPDHYYNFLSEVSTGDRAQIPEHGDSNAQDERRVALLLSGETAECTAKTLKVGDCVRVMQAFTVRSGAGQTFLRTGWMGKVAHRASGEFGITHIKFEEMSEPAVVMCKDFPKLAILLSEPETAAPQENSQHTRVGSLVSEPEFPQENGQKTRVDFLPSGQTRACTPATLKVGDFIRVMQPFDVRSGDSQIFLREGLIGKVAHRTSGERGITRIKFEDMSEQVVVLGKYFPKLAILLSKPESETQEEGEKAEALAALTETEVRDESLAAASPVAAAPADPEVRAASPTAAALADPEFTAASLAAASAAAAPAEPEVSTSSRAQVLHSDSTTQGEHRVGVLPSGETSECKPKSLKVGDSVRVVQPFSVRSGDGQIFLREGLVGKVAHRASGERGITHVKFEDMSQQVVILSRDFSKLVILLSKSQLGGPCVETAPQLDLEVRAALAAAPADSAPAEPEVRAAPAAASVAAAEMPAPDASAAGLVAVPPSRAAPAKPVRALSVAPFAAAAAAAEVRAPDASAAVVAAVSSSLAALAKPEVRAASVAVAAPADSESELAASSRAHIPQHADSHAEDESAVRCCSLSGEPLECTLKSFRVGDSIRVMQDLFVSSGGGQTFLREGMIGKVSDCASGENGITHIKFEDMSEPAAPMRSDFSKLAVVFGDPQEDCQHTRIGCLPSGEKVVECTPKSLKVGDNIRVMQPFDVRSGDGHATLREGLVGKVAHRASGERGITHMKFEDMPQQVAVLCKDFPKLAVLLSRRALEAPQKQAEHSRLLPTREKVMECTAKSLKTGDSVRVIERFYVRGGEGQRFLQKGSSGKVVHRASGSFGITHIKFEDVPEKAIVMCKDFKNLAIVAARPDDADDEEPAVVIATLQNLSQVYQRPAVPELNLGVLREGLADFQDSPPSTESTAPILQQQMRSAAEARWGTTSRGLESASASVVWPARASSAAPPIEVAESAERDKSDWLAQWHEQRVSQAPPEWQQQHMGALQAHVARKMLSPRSDCPSTSTAVQLSPLASPRISETVSPMPSPREQQQMSLYGFLRAPISSLYGALEYATSSAVTPSVQACVSRPPAVNATAAVAGVGTTSKERIAWPEPLSNVDPHVSAWATTTWTDTYVDANLEDAPRPATNQANDISRLSASRLFIS